MIIVNWFSLPKGDRVFQNHTDASFENINFQPTELRCSFAIKNDFLLPNSQ